MLTPGNNITQGFGYVTASSESPAFCETFDPGQYQGRLGRLPLFQTGSFNVSMVCFCPKK